jgi:hypothetical protein
MNEDSFDPRKGQKLYLLPRAQTGSVALLASYLLRIGGCSLQVNRQARKPGHPSPSSAEMGNAWNCNYLLTPWSRALIEKLTSLQLVKKFTAFYGTESSLPYSQVPATCPYPEPTPSSPHHPLKNHLKL